MATEEDERTAPPPSLQRFFFYLVITLLTCNSKKFLASSRKDCAANFKYARCSFDRSQCVRAATIRLPALALDDFLYSLKAILLLAFAVSFGTFKALVSFILVIKPSIVVMAMIQVDGDARGGD